MPKREKGKAERRGRILDAAVRLMKSQDVQALTVNDIAISAGVAQATVFNLFGNKSCLIIAVLEREGARVDQKIFEIHGDALEKIFASLDVISKSCQLNPDHYRLLFSTQKNNDITSSHNADIGLIKLALWEDFVVRCVKDKYLCANTPVLLLANACFNLTFGTIYSFLSEYRPIDILSYHLAYGISNCLIANIGEADAARLYGLRDAAAKNLAYAESKVGDPGITALRRRSVLRRLGSLT